MLVFESHEDFTLIHLPQPKICVYQSGISLRREIKCLKGSKDVNMRVLLGCLNKISGICRFILVGYYLFKKLRFDTFFIFQFSQR